RRFGQRPAQQALEQDAAHAVDLVLRRHSGARGTREPGIHNHRPGIVDSGLAAARRPGMTERVARKKFHRSCPEYEQLNDLLQRGRWATMLPPITASSSGHWNQDGSRR